MSEEELNEAMQYNLDYTEAMLSDELFGTNEVAEVKLLASEKTIKDLQQKVEQLEKENKELNRMCELYGQSLYNADLTKAEKKVEQLENIRKEAIEELSYMSTDAYVEDYDIREKHYNLLMNILNKGE